MYQPMLKQTALCKGVTMSPKGMLGHPRIVDTLRA